MFNARIEYNFEKVISTIPIEKNQLISVCICEKTEDKKA